jgi:hypothetical protein
VCAPGVTSKLEKLFASCTQTTVGTHPAAQIAMSFFIVSSWKSSKPVLPAYLGEPILGRWFLDVSATISLNSSKWDYCKTPATKVVCVYIYIYRHKSVIAVKGSNPPNGPMDPNGKIGSIGNNLKYWFIIRFYEMASIKPFCNPTEQVCYSLEISCIQVVAASKMLIIGNFTSLYHFTQFPTVFGAHFHTL